LAQKKDSREAKIKQAIASLPDVQSSNVEFDRDGTILAIHIVASTRRPAKQIVRDVESILIADFDIKVDHRKVSVARIEHKAGGRPARALRPKFVSLKLETAAGKGKAEVVLERAEFEATGEAEGITASGGNLRLIALATLRAVGKLIGGDAGFELLDVIRIKAGERYALVVLANYVVPDSVRNLAGCVQFEDNEHEATVLASLDACNRIVELSPRLEHTEYEVIPFAED
jgi:hypothetical protein